MEEVRQTVSLDRRREGSPARALAEQRDQIRRYLNELAESADAAEREIAESVRQLMADVAAGVDGAQSKRDAAQSARLTERAKQLEAREQELEERAVELDRRDAAVADATRLKSRYEERLRRLDEREEELEAEQQRTKAQRRRIAAELRDERESARREARRAAEDLEATRDELRRKQDELQRRTAEVDRREAELATTAAAKHGDAQLREQLASLESSLAERNAALAELAAEVDDLQLRLNDYRAQLADAEARLVDAEAHRNDGAETAEWRRRYEEAAENVRDLKLRCAALEKANAAAGANAAASRGESEMPMDWESQKRRILAALEATDSDGESIAPADRMTIEGTIQITDSVIAEKDREIAELKRRVDEQADGPTDAAVDAALAQDEVIARHRAETERLRTEWSEKLRQAEIELSLERAKLARERTELDERRADLEAQQAHDAKNPPTVVTPGRDAGKPAAGGRWLARLGLREKEE